MQIFLVGGAVRDSLLNLPIKDKDWVVVGSTPNEMFNKGFQKVGKNFPVFLHPHSHEEYALARTERKVGKGYVGFVTLFTPDVTLMQDLKRRDLTINAMAQDKNGILFDPYGGYKDLKSRILRHVSSAFNEDPLRILRVARFAAKLAHLNFKIAKETENLMIKMTSSGELANLTKERIWKETEKALLTLNPQIYFHVLRNCGALKVLFPEIDNLYELSTTNIIHSEVNIEVHHSLMSLALVAKLSNELDVRFATLLQNIGKVLTLPKKFIDYKEYNVSGIPIIQSLCERFNIPKQIRNLALIVNQFHSVVHNIQDQSAHSLVALFDHIDAWRKPQRIEQLALTSEADARVRRYGSVLELENVMYWQGNYLRTAFSLAQSILTKDIILAGFKGKYVKEELTKRRIIAIEKGLMNM
ncbi:multifunctional CCA addition/repair protein [Pantoea sp. Aalb]|uniref:multifunctional CCA addition/repair protein n=1 Tax=Pantoea sp. Aalb TaxID=2576762 RepID=UPI00132460AF|nr:multifunctional CCA addition/repair protein [Pantoea sp. Aalb]MXP67704.1 multifunctional CCA addition/repair protein [Pantoea sp. Aalb]